MSQNKLFGTDGVRGVANQSPMTPEMAMALGRATAYLLCESHTLQGTMQPPKVVIGKDTRLSGYMIENALAAGFCSMGVKVFLVGPLPTPGIAFITRSMRADAGLVISASHNPYQYNGIKIFDRHGFKLPDAMEKKIENLMGSEELNRIRPTEDYIGRARRIDDAIGRYIVYIKDTFPDEMNLEGMRVVLDCANGAAYKIAPIVFEELGAEVFALNCQPDGKNINDRCGAVFPGEMAKSVRSHRAEIGIALDGDADRLILSDENGEVVNGDEIMAICAKEMIENGTLHHNTVCTTPMSNMGLGLAIEAMGGRVVEAPVGDRYVVEKMKKLGLNFGGEQSGHIIFLGHNTTGDALIASLKVLAIMKRTGKKLSELRQVMNHYPQIQKNIIVREKKAFTEFPKIVESIAKAEKALGKSGRVLVRYSGTEPLARVMVEGEKLDDINLMAQDIAHSIEVHLS